MTSNSNRIGRGYWQVQGELRKDFIINEYRKATIKKLECVCNAVFDKYHEYVTPITINRLLKKWGER